MRISDWSSDVCSSDLGDDAILRKSRQLDDRFGLLERQIVELRPDVGAQRIDFGRNGKLGEARILDPCAFDVAVQRRRLAEQPRPVVAAARQFARQHGLRVGDAGTDLKLAGDEDFAAPSGTLGRAPSWEEVWT